MNLHYLLWDIERGIERFVHFIRSRFVRIFYAAGGYLGTMVAIGWSSSGCIPVHRIRDNTDCCLLRTLLTHGSSVLWWHIRDTVVCKENDSFADQDRVDCTVEV